MNLGRYSLGKGTALQESDYQQKLRSIGFSKHRGTNKVVPVLSEKTGDRVGFHTEHWSGRVDATAERFSVAVNPAIRGSSDNQCG